MTITITEVLLVILLAQGFYLIFQIHRKSSQNDGGAASDGRSGPKPEGRSVLLLTEADLANSRSGPKPEGRSVYVLQKEADLADVRSGPKPEGRYVIMTDTEWNNTRSDPKLESGDVGIVVSKEVISAFINSGRAEINLTKKNVAQDKTKGN